MREDLSEKLSLIDPEDYLMDRGVDYRVTRGSSGTQLNIKECPRCGGTGWKVYLNADTGLGNCFHGACVGEPGYNIFTFIRELEGGSNSDTLREIDRHVKDLGWRPKREKQEVFESEAPFQMPASEEIEEMDEAYKYLFRRGFDLFEVGYFGWRYCKKSWYSYQHRSIEQHQLYEKRILIPIYDIHGQLKTFQGRDITGKANKKYLFPPGLPSSGRFLYNAHRCRSKKVVVICEGVMDVAAASKAIETNEIGVVGSFGKSLSTSDDSGGDDQLGALLALKQHGVEEFVMMWDSESSTRKAAINTALSLRSMGLTSSVAFLPDGKDPNEVPPEQVEKSFENRQVIGKRQALKMRLMLKNTN